MRWVVLSDSLASAGAMPSARFTWDIVESFGCACSDCGGETWELDPTRGSERGGKRGSKWNPKRQDGRVQMSWSLVDQAEVGQAGVALRRWHRWATTTNSSASLFSHTSRVWVQGSPVLVLHVDVVKSTALTPGWGCPYLTKLSWFWSTTTWPSTSTEHKCS